MKKLILIAVCYLFIACNERDFEERDFGYLIQVNFKTEKVKEGWKDLNKSDYKATLFCQQIIKGNVSLNDYSFKELCLGSDGHGTNYMYVQLSTLNVTEVHLITYKENKILVNTISDYNQNDCVKRWIIQN